jgi:hypothetical protein
MDAKFCRRCGKSRSDLERAERSGAGIALAEASTPAESASQTSVQSVADSSKVDVDSSSTVELDSPSPAVVDASFLVDVDGSSPIDVDSPSPVEVEPPKLDGVVSASPQSVDPNPDSVNATVVSVNIEEDISVSSQPDLATPECPSCWKALRATDKFCCWCGEAQPNRVLPFLKLCLECSTFLPEKANYCYSCGTDVGYSSRRKVRVPHELFKDEESEFFPRFDA